MRASATSADAARSAFFRSGAASSLLVVACALHADQILQFRAEPLIRAAQEFVRRLVIRSGVALT